MLNTTLEKIKKEVNNKSMKIMLVLIVFAFFFQSVLAVECTQSQAIQDLLAGQKTQCENAQKQDKGEYMDTLKELNKRPLWTDEQINSMAKEQAETHPIADTPGVMYLVPLGL